MEFVRNHERVNFILFIDTNSSNDNPTKPISLRPSGELCFADFPTLRNGFFLQYIQNSLSAYVRRQAFKKRRRNWNSVCSEKVACHKENNVLQAKEHTKCR